jgi:hypothetical protein
LPHSDSESNRKVGDRSRDITIHRLERGNTTKQQIGNTTKQQIATTWASTQSRQWQIMAHDATINRQRIIHQHNHSNIIFWRTWIIRGDTTITSWRRETQEDLWFETWAPLVRWTTHWRWNKSTTKGFEGVKIDTNNNQPREEWFA